MTLNKSTFNRLKKILENDKMFTVPPGLTREEKRQFIFDCACGKIKPDQKK